MIWSLLKASEHPGHQLQEANLRLRFLFTKYMKFWDWNFIVIYSSIYQESPSGFELKLSKAISKLVPT